MPVLDCITEACQKYGSFHSVRTRGGDNRHLSQPSSFLESHLQMGNHHALRATAPRILLSARSGTALAAPSEYSIEGWDSLLAHMHMGLARRIRLFIAAPHGNRGSYHMPKRHFKNY